jgi:sterol desaturase/sphingolipid hydroxylase (fatty acid hydroxylase superfamily)
MAAFWFSPSVLWSGSSEWPSYLRMIWSELLSLLLIPAAQYVVYTRRARHSHHLLQPRPWRDGELALDHRAARTAVYLHVGFTLASALRHWYLRGPEHDSARLKWLERDVGTGSERVLFRYAQVALVLVVVDAFAYWMHRALHYPWLYSVHKFHHEATKVRPWLAGWVHVVELVLMSVPVMMLPPYLCEWPIAWAGFWSSLHVSHGFYSHSGLRCESVPGLQLMPCGKWWWQWQWQWPERSGAKKLFMHMD